MTQRLQTKCLLGSVAFHGLLLLLLVLGSGFVTDRTPATEPLALLTFIPDRLVDAPFVGGGGTPAAPPESANPPTAQPEPPRVEPNPPPPAKPVEPSVKPPAPQPREPEAKPKPDKKPAKPPKPLPEKPAKPEAAPDPEPRKPVPKHKIEVNKVLTERRDTARERERARRAAEEAEAAEAAEAAAAADRARRAAEARRSQFNNALSGLQNRFSSSTGISVPGPGGESYANYGLFVKSVYDWAWRAPEDVADGSATVRVRVTIARNGKVVRTEILSKSGVAALDRSVVEALGRVDTIGRPFPEGAREEQRNFILRFNLNARRAAG